MSSCPLRTLLSISLFAVILSGSARTALGASGMDGGFGYEFYDSAEGAAVPGGLPIFTGGA